MKRWLLCSVAALAAAGAGAWTVSYIKGGTERAIEARYTRIDSAMNSKDISGLMSILTPDYTEIHLNLKPTSRGEAEAHYRQIFQDWTVYRQEPIIMNQFTSSGSETVANMERKASGEVVDRAGAFGAKGAKHQMKLDTLNVDTWVLTGGRWLLKKHVIALAKTFVDGKPILGASRVEDND